MIEMLKIIYFVIVNMRHVRGEFKIFPPVVFEAIDSVVTLVWCPLAVAVTRRKNKTSTDLKWSDST